MFSSETKNAGEPPEFSEEQAAQSLGTYVVSMQPKSGFRRLHRVGECSYRPGVHYGIFHALGSDAPSPTEFHARCKLCFKDELIASEGAEETATSSGSSSPESSIE